MSCCNIWKTRSPVGANSEVSIFNSKREFKNHKWDDNQLIDQFLNIQNVAKARKIQVKDKTLFDLQMESYGINVEEKMPPKKVDDSIERRLKVQVIRAPEKL